MKTKNAATGCAIAAIIKAITNPKILIIVNILFSFLPCIKE